MPEKQDGTFYVETFRDNPRGIGYQVYRYAEYSRDVLHPSMTAVFEVNCCRTKAQAVALVIEHAAGLNVTVHRIFGGD